MRRIPFAFAATAAACLALAGCGRDDSVPPAAETGAPAGSLSSGPTDTAHGTVSGDAAGSTGAITTTTPDAGVAATPGALPQNAAPAAAAASAASAAQ